MFEQKQTNLILDKVRLKRTVVAWILSSAQAGQRQMMEF